MSKRVHGFLVVVCLLVCLCVAGTARAAVIRANGTNCTLDQAIVTANSTTGAVSGTCTAGSSTGTDEIELEYDVVLESALTSITTSIVIRGRPGNRIIERAPHLGCSATEATPFRIFTVTGGSLGLEDLTLRNGCRVGTTESGGAITSSAALTLNRCTIERNVVRATGAAAGAAVSTSASLTVTNSTFRENVAYGGTTARGGAVDATSTVTIFGTAFQNNKAMGTTSSSGGAIYSPGGLAFDVLHATFVSNEADGGAASGGALHIGSGSSTSGTKKIERVIFRGNRAASRGGSSNVAQGGAVYAAGNIGNLLNTQFEGNDADASASSGKAGGGGMFMTGAVLTNVTEVTFGSNKVTAGSSAEATGGGLSLDDTSARTVTLMRNATFTGNVVLGGSASTRHGGGLFIRNFTITTMTHATMTGNVADSTSGGGLHIAAGTVTPDHLLLAGNSGQHDCVAAANSITAGIEKFNYIGTHSGCGHISGIPTAADLGTLADNGCLPGRKMLDGTCLKTVALSANSSVRDRGGMSVVADARGATRPFDLLVDNHRDGNGADPGAFELHNTPPSIAGPATIEVTEGTETAIAPVLAGGTAPSISEADPPHHLQGGWLEVWIENATAHETLSIATADGIAHDTNTGRVTTHNSDLGAVHTTHHGKNGAKLRIESLTLRSDSSAMTALLKSIRYRTTHDTPPATRTIRVQVDDGRADLFGDATSTSAVHTVTATISVQHDPPVVFGLAGHTNGYHEDVHQSGGLRIIAATHVVTVTDPDTADFSGGSLRVWIENGIATREWLSSPSHPTTDVDLTIPLGASTSADAVASLIKSVHYHTGDHPPTASRTIKYELKDPNLQTSGVHSVPVGITAVNDPPSFVSGFSTATQESGAVVLAPNATVSDPEHGGLGDWGGARLHVQREGGPHADDDFTWTTTPKATFLETAGKLTVTFLAGATTTEVNQIIGTISYRNTAAAAPGSVKIEFLLTDSGHATHGVGGPRTSGAALVTVTINFVNDRPVIRNVDGRERTFTENATPVAIASIDASIDDPDRPAHFSGARLRVSVASATAQDVLQIGGTTSGNVTHGTLGTVGTMTFDSATGAIEVEFNDKATDEVVGAVLRRVTYHTGEVPQTPRTVVFRFTDGGDAQGAGKLTSDDATATIIVLRENDPPDLAGFSTAELRYHPANAKATPASSATITDPELHAASNWHGAVLTVSQAIPDPKDLFSFTAGLASGNEVRTKETPTSPEVVRGTFTARDGVLTIHFNSQARTSDVQAILRGIEFSRAAGNVLAGDITLRFTISDGNTGSQGNGGTLTDTETREIKRGTLTQPAVTIQRSPAGTVAAGTQLTVTADVSPTSDVPSTLQVWFEAGSKETPCAARPVGGTAGAAVQCTLTPLVAGARTIEAFYAGSAVHDVSSATHAVTVRKALTKTTVGVAGTAASQVGVPLEITFTVANDEGAANTLTIPGTARVDVYNDTTLLCHGTVSAGKCEYTPTAAGTLSLKAKFAETDALGYSESAVVSRAVSLAATATHIRGVAPSFSLAGQDVVVTVHVSSEAGAIGGTVTVSDGAATSLAANVVNGVAVCTIRFTTDGTKALTATYSGTLKHAPSSSSPPFPHLVKPAGGVPTSITIAAPGSASHWGQAVTINWSVMAGTQSVTAGDVTVFDRAGGSCTGPAAQGQCSWTPAGTGTRTLYAMYHGTAEHAASTSSTVTHTVNKLTTSIAIHSRTPATSKTGEAVVVKVKVTPDPGDGTASVISGPQSCTASIGAAGEGTCSLFFASAGTHQIVATYHGNTGYASSPPSAPTDHVVSAAPVAGTGRRKGDLDNSGGVDTGDALKVLKHLVKSRLLTAEEECPADFDGVDGITTQDALGILKCAATGAAQTVPPCKTTRCSN